MSRGAFPDFPVLAVFALAVVLRVGLFPFEENKHGDAPMRALIAEWMNLDPHAAADPRTYCQFGPLHTTLMSKQAAFQASSRFCTRWLVGGCGESPVEVDTIR